MKCESWVDGSSILQVPCSSSRFFLKKIRNNVLYYYSIKKRYVWVVRGSNVCRNTETPCFMTKFLKTSRYCYLDYKYEKVF